MRLVDRLTPRNLVTAALLLLVGVMVVVGFQSVQTSSAAKGECPVPGTPILQVSPCNGDSGLNQGRITVDLAAGWQVDLYLDGQPIPKDELSIEGSLYSYTPGQGGSGGALAPGLHSMRAVYYQNLADEATGKTYSWYFTTH